MESSYQAESQVTAVRPLEKPAAPPTATEGGSRIGVILALLAVYIVWGSTYLGIHFALEGFPPFLMAGIRFLIAGAGMYVFLRARGAPTPSRRQWGAGAIIGFLLLVGGNGGVSVAEQSIPSGLAALGIATTPLWAALFAGLWGRWPARWEWAGLALGFGGVALLSLEGGVRANALGAALLLLAALCWGLGSVWSPRLPMPAGAMASAVEMLAGGAILLLLGLFSGEQITAVPGPRALVALGYLILFGSLVGFSAFGYLLRHVRSTIATSYAYVNPAVAVVLGALLAGEQITLVGVVAMAVILAGVALVTLGRVRD
jgi:drug/metabolite transporter (DMT)-like permease